MTIFQLQYMTNQDLREAEAALTVGHDETVDKTGELHNPGGADKSDTPRWFIHGTGVHEALSILNARTIRSYEKCGPLV